MLMKVLGVLAVWIILCLTQQSPVRAGPFHCTDQQIKNGTCTENPFGNYGTVNNSTCAASPKGICGAAEAINSFTFLKKTYPKIYGSTSIDTGGEKTSADAANDFAAKGFAGKDGYYTRFNKDGPSKQYEDYLATKMDWFQAYAPNKTRFEVRGKEADLPKADQQNPNGSFLFNQVQDGEDVELFIFNTVDQTKHVISLVGLSWMPANKKDKKITCHAPQTCQMDFQDPNTPNTEGGLPISASNGLLSFDYMSASWNIVAAFAESPKMKRKVAEPDAGAVFLVALVVGHGGGAGWRPGVEESGWQWAASTEVNVC